MSVLFPYRLRYVGSNLSHAWYCLCSVVRNAWAWRIALTQCECCLNLSLLQAHLKQVERCYDRYDLHAYHDDTVKQIRVARSLLDRYIADEYNQDLIDAERSIKDTNDIEAYFRQPLTPRQQRLIKQAMASRDRDWKYLWDIVKKHGQGWWT